MKFKFLLFAFVTCNYIFLTASAQTQPKEDIKYRRSSLHTMIIESEKFPQKEVVVNAFNNAPFPEKYNNHTIGTKSFDPKNYTLTAEEKALIYKAPSKLGKLTASATNMQVDSVEKELPVRIQKFLDKEQVANQLVAKWFDRKADGSFDMNLIGQRGAYNASEMETNIAKGSARGMASIADAGEELIGNTFVVISKFNFVSNETTAAAVREAAKAAAESIKISLAKEAAIKSADAAYEKAKEGYTIWTTSYLYKLVWNDSVAAIFYNDLWMDSKNIDPKKKAAFDKSSLFKLEFVGDEKASGLVLFSLKEKRTENQIIEIGTIRTIDAIYAKLQKKYDVFKPKTPLFTGNPITAKIGTKEGLEGGEKFDVLEQTVDPKTGLTKYVNKGTITVDKDLIWDNRYNAGEDLPVDPAITTPAPAIDRTTFKGGKSYYSGMLIKQSK